MTALVFALRTNGPTSTSVDTVSDVCRDQYRCRCTHGVSDDDSRTAELFDEGAHVAGGLHVSVGGERRIAVTVSPKVGARNAVAVVAERRCQEPVGASQVAHAGNEHHERTGAVDVVGDPPFGS